MRRRNQHRCERHPIQPRGARRRAVHPARDDAGEEARHQHHGKQHVCRAEILGLARERPTDRGERAVHEKAREDDCGREEQGGQAEQPRELRQALHHLHGGGRLPRHRRAGERRSEGDPPGERREPHRHLQNSGQRRREDLAEHHRRRFDRHEEEVHQLGRLLHQHAPGDALPVEQHHEVEHHQAQIRHEHCQHAIHRVRQRLFVRRLKRGQPRLGAQDIVRIAREERRIRVGIRLRETRPLRHGDSEGELPALRALERDEQHVRAAAGGIGGRIIRGRPALRAQVVEPAERDRLALCAVEHDDLPRGAERHVLRRAPRGGGRETQEQRREQQAQQRQQDRQPPVARLGELTAKREGKDAAQSAKTVFHACAPPLAIFSSCLSFTRLPRWTISSR